MLNYIWIGLIVSAISNLKQALPICAMCGRQMRYCSECGSPVKKEDDVCPNCGARRPGAEKRPGA